MAAYCFMSTEKIKSLEEENALLKTQLSEKIQMINLQRQENESLEEQLVPLTEFKKNAERKDKEAMIKSFYMLSDEDKADVIKNIDTYSLDDIEAKLVPLDVFNEGTLVKFLQL